MTTPDGPFWELVKAEFRATWCGRWRWFWRIAGIGVLGCVGNTWFEGNPWPLRAVPILGLGIGYLAALALGSDLQSVGFSANPEPQREWPGRALLARSIGRLAGLLPFLAVIAVFAHVPMTMALGVDMEKAPGYVRSRWLECVQTLVHGCFLFALAGLLSAAIRRPRRFVVTGLVYFPLLAENRLHRSGTQFGPMPEALSYSLYAWIQEVFLHVSVALAHFAGLDTTTMMWSGRHEPYWISIPLQLTAVAMLGAVIGLIAAHRGRRRPYSISLPEEAITQAQ